MTDSKMTDGERDNNDENNSGQQQSEMQAQQGAGYVSQGSGYYGDNPATRETNTVITPTTRPVIKPKSSIVYPGYTDSYLYPAVAPPPLERKSYAAPTPRQHETSASGYRELKSYSASTPHQHETLASGYRGQVQNTYYGASRFVTGEERVIGYNTIQQEERVVSERVVTHEVKVPKKIVREEVIEKVIIVPETITREEVIEEVQTVRETIVEVAKPVVQEKIVEVCEIEYRDKIVEVVEKIQQTKIKEVPRVEYVDRVIEIPRIVPREKVVEVPEIEYREVVTEKIVEVPEIREEYVTRQVPGPVNYVEKAVPQYVDVEVPIDIETKLPVPIEAVTTFEYQLAQFRPRVNKVTYPLYVPRFVEVPISAELFDASTAEHLRAQATRLTHLNGAQAVGLCDVERLATDFRQIDLKALQTSSDIRTALQTAWATNSMPHLPPVTA